jgi:hypothetical protein
VQNLHIVKEVAYLEGYRLSVTFGDYVEKIVDLQPFRIDSELDTIVWDNGADVAPDFLYEIGVEVRGQTVTGSRTHSQPAQ